MKSPDPFHVFYGGAHLFREGLAAKLTRHSLTALERFVADNKVVRNRIAKRLAQDAVQDLRIDFEDGFGARPPEEEDSAATSTGTICAKDSTLPRMWGIRVRALHPSTKSRALRTLELFVGAGARPPVVTLPKVEGPEEVEMLADHLTRLGLASGIELMVETPAALPQLRALIDACGGHCAGLHFGAYDFLSALGVAAPDQSLHHPFCDQARYSMQLAAAAAGVRVVDGVTSLLPVEPDAQRGWDLHIANVRRSLAQGCFASWDLHPAQVAARYVALYGYFDEHKASLGVRLRKFLDDQTQATRVGAAFDDAATVRGLVQFFARGIACGAVEESEVAALTGRPWAAVAAHA